MQPAPERDHVTAPLPWVSFCTVTEKICCAPVPNVTAVGETLTEMALTVNGAPLLGRPFTVTTTLPVVAPTGTGATIPVLVHVVGVADVPLNVRALVPCVEPKFAPAMVTEVPTDPEVGERLLMLGGAITVKSTLLLGRPLTVTTTFPVVAPVGAGTTMLDALQLVGVAAVPLNVTVLLPCVEAKFVPVIVTEVPTAPDVGLRLEMLGEMLNNAVLLATPETTTLTPTKVNGERSLGTVRTTLVSLQLVTVAVEEPNVTELVP